jgi:ADP-L-glycero-D-manno-heptose 6-epimerase
MDKWILVTGGAGFIGSNLVRALNRRGLDNILVVDHLNHPGKQRNLDRLRFRRYLDKTEFRSLLRAGDLPKPSAVFHLGACSSTTETNEDYLRDNNDRFTRDLCEWALHSGARFIYASSAATYGDGAQGYSDDDAVTPTLKPLNPYGRSKHRFDLWALETGTLRAIAGLKYFNVYGPGEDHKGDMRSMVNKAYAQVLRDGAITLFRSHRPDYRDGEQDRDFLHVDDAVAMTLFFYDRPDVSGLFNCGTGTARTWLDLARALFAALDRPPRIVFTDMPEAIRNAYQYHTQADMSKIRKAGFLAPFLNLEEGVRRYVREYLMAQPQG